MTHPHDPQTNPQALVEAASAKAEAQFAEHYPELATIIIRAISMYRFDTPADRSRAHEVARIVARNVVLSLARKQIAENL